MSEENTKKDIKNGNKLPTYYDDPIDLFYKKYILSLCAPKKLSFTTYFKYKLYAIIMARYRYYKSIFCVL